MATPPSTLTAQLPPEPAPTSAVSAARPVALVTGAARRIGRAIALELAGAGWDLALHVRALEADAQATAREAQALGARVAVLTADLRDATACRALVPQAVAALGRLDAVVNNASTFQYDDALSADVEAALDHLRANTLPAVLLAQGLYAHVLEREAATSAGASRPATPGCVVNLLDQKLRQLNPDYFSYTLSKAALEAATVMQAQALAPWLRVVGVAPGVTLPSGPMTEAQFAQAHRMTPLQRSSTPEDVAQAVRYVLGAPALTGSTLLVDGGQHLWGMARDVLFAASPHAGGR